jgi:peroxiredoxin Q/BCP
MAKLEPGTAAPDFELEDADGKTWQLADLSGRRVILYFYPIDDTPGCTVEACDFRDSYKELHDSGYIVLGVSPQGPDSHRAFADKYGLPFPLLIDEDGAVARKYGAWEERGDYKGMPLLFTRSTFVIDENSNIAEALYGVSAKGHVASLRETLRV